MTREESIEFLRVGYMVILHNIDFLSDAESWSDEKIQEAVEELDWLWK